MPQWTDDVAHRPERRANIAITIAIVFLFVVAGILTWDRERHQFPADCIVLNIDQDARTGNFTTVRLHCRGIINREDIHTK